MKVVSLVLLAAFSFIALGCSDVSRNAVELEVNFSGGGYDALWDGNSRNSCRGDTWKYETTCS